MIENSPFRTKTKKAMCRVVKLAKKCEPLAAVQTRMRISRKKFRVLLDKFRKICLYQASIIVVPSLSILDDTPTEKPVDIELLQASPVAEGEPPKVQILPPSSPHASPKRGNSSKPCPAMTRASRDTTRPACCGWALRTSTTWLKPWRSCTML